MNRVRIKKTDLAGVIVDRGKGRCRVLLDSYDAPLWLYNDEIEPIPRVCAARKERQRGAAGGSDMTDTYAETPQKHKARESRTRRVPDVRGRA